MKEKIKKINELLSKLYCFNSVESDALLKKVTRMREEGLNEMIKVLEVGLKEQEKLLKKWVEREPLFAEKLIHHIQKIAIKLSNEYEKNEKKSAESILTELNIS